MTAGPPAASVVVCSYSERRWDDLQAAIASLQAQAQPALEIILVVDHNPALLARAAGAFPGVAVLANEGGRGLSGARNTGVARARGAVVAFLDDDAVAGPDWLGRLLAHYADPTVLGVGGSVTPLWAEGRPRWFPREFDWVIGCSYTGQPQRTAEVRNLIGCNMSFRRDLFEALGGFREGLGREGANALGGEETEFCIRALAARPGSRLLYDPGIVVRHRMGRERGTWRYFRARCAAEGRSKALLVRLVGGGSGLSAERRYTLRVLPMGVLRGLADTARGDPWGLARAAAIATGFAWTSASHLREKMRPSARGSGASPAFAPIRVGDIEIEAPLPTLPASDAATGTRFGAAFCLLRRGGCPVGILEAPLPADGLPPAELARLIDRSLGRQAGAPSPAAPRRADDAPFVSVVVATRDRADSLAATLDSLLAQDYAPFEVVVVDNAPSSPQTAELVAGRYATAGVRYLREDRPGLGHAHNVGLAGVAAPIVAFTDDDVIADPRWLSALAAEFASGPRVGCVTGLILPLRLDTRAQYWTERYAGFAKGFERRVFDRDENRPGDRLFPFAAGRFGSGANMTFRTEALRRIGGFDPALGAGTPARGGDDLAAFFAVIEAGWQLVYLPAAVVWHRHREAEAGIRRQAFGYGVGLGAYLTKLVVDRPGRALRMAAAAPSGLAYLLAPSSPKNSRLPADYPSGLVWRERLGILAGVPAYLRSRAAVRRAVRRDRSPPLTTGSDGIASRVRC
ncbi:MAG: glycosyltransferase family 2 protein [Rhodospirillaceae bacterium]|nr:glycosyltransferase family 2 protein [Rhodospirillaceae bacterium]